MPVSTQKLVSTHTAGPARALPPETGNQTGFYLWVGVDPAQTPAGQAPIKSSQIIEIAEALGELAREFLPTAQTHTTLSLSALDSPRHTATASYVPPIQPRRTNKVVSNSSLPNSSLPNSSLPNFDHVLRPRVTIDLHTRQVIADDRVERLTYKEFELLAHLVTAKGAVVSREELFRTVWAGEPSQDSRTIDVHVRRLREKLGIEQHIITVRGRGYKFALTDQIDVIEATSRHEFS